MLVELAGVVGVLFIVIGVARFVGVAMYMAGMWQWLSVFSFLFGSIPVLTSALLLDVFVGVGLIFSGAGLVMDSHYGRIGALVFSVFLFFDYPVGTAIGVFTFILMLLPPLSKEYGKLIKRKENVSFRAIGVAVVVVGVVSLAYFSGFAHEIQTDFQSIPTTSISPQSKIDISSNVMEEKRGEEMDTLLFLTAPTGELSIRQQRYVVQDVTTLGGEVTGQLSYASNVIRADLTPSEIENISTNRHVRRIAENRVVVPLPAVSSSSNSSNYSFSGFSDYSVHCLDDTYGILDAREAWSDGNDGDGVVVAVMDTGVNPNVSALTRENGESVVVDEYEIYDDWVHFHGTSVACCIASQNSSYPGISPNAGILDVEVFQDTGAATYDILWGFEKIVEYKRNHDIFVISSNSWGVPASSIGGGGWSNPSSISLAANNLATRWGIPVVAAMGNYNSDTGLEINVPATAEHVLSVGATDKSGDWADFSCTGPTPDGHRKPDVVAPGQSINSFGPDGELMNLDGTSFSTPFVAGSLACIAEATSYQYSPSEYYASIRQSADDIGKPGFDIKTGYGMIDITEASEIAGTLISGDSWQNISIAFLFVGVGIVFYPEWGKKIEEIT